MNCVCVSLCVRLRWVKRGCRAAGHSNNSLESGARLLAPFGSGAIQLCFYAHKHLRAQVDPRRLLDQEEVNTRVNGKSAAVSQSHYTLSSCILGNSRILRL
jgi:hypothetical protein